MAEGGGFAIERLGERSEGLAQGVDRKHLLRLRRGERRIERRVDLHGLVAAEAKRLLARELTSAQTEGLRCVLVIHGRGLHSEDGPVLREGVVAWLTTEPLARRVMAFASARPEHGGPGASYVLLRRIRTAR
ncbi:MAG: Smr/MutS family protein [Myxococcota bacterium]